MTKMTSDAEREIANIRCLVAQQIQTIERHGETGPERHAADRLLRQLLRHDENVRRRLLDARPGL